MGGKDTSADGSQGALRDLFARARKLSDVPDTDVHIVELLRVYVRFKPGDGVAWFYLGDALRVIGRFREAEEALLRSVDLAPRSERFAIYARIAMLMEKRGSPSDAEKWYRVATAEPGCPGWMWTLRGANLSRMESHRLAETCLKTALRCEDVVKDEVFLNLALIARAEGRYDDAQAYAREALAIDPELDGASRVLESLKEISQTIESAASVARMLNPSRD